MLRFFKRVCLLPIALLSVPQAAHAADFGFVRWPDYLDLPIVAAAIMTALSAVVLKTQMPKGAKDYVSIPKEQRTVPLKLSVVVAIASFALCMGMVFAGMGLARAAEW